MEQQEILDRQIEAAQERLRALLESAGAAPEQRALLAEAMEALSASLEELHVAGEELRQQNEELYIARQMLEEERRKYQELFEFAPDGYLVTGAEGIIREANQAAAGLLGVSQASLVGQPLAGYVEAEERDAFRRQVAGLAQAERTQGWELHLRTAAGRPFPAAITVAVARDVQGRVIGLRWQVRDISERVQTEKALRDSEERFRQIAGSIEEVFWLVEPGGGRVIYASPAYERVWGRPLQEIMADPDAFFAPIHPDDRQLVQQTIQRYSAGESTDVEYRFFRPDGSVRWLWDRAFPLRRADGTVYRIAGVAADVTGRKQAEEGLRAALAEKEVLMREIYHRVKNNVQALIYLMDMQAEYIADPDVRAMIRELQERARAMALVHEKLYQSQNLAQIDFGAYLNDLVDSLSRAFDSADRSITWRVEAENVPLGVDTAIPCGLIVSELLMNALKYAFPGGRPRVERGETECQIRIEFRADAGRFALTVGDNGVGLPAGMDWTTAQSLGLQLINILACHQLGGQVEVDRQAGTTFKIVFTERERKRKQGDG